MEHIAGKFSQFRHWFKVSLYFCVTFILFDTTSQFAKSEPNFRLVNLHIK